MTTMALTPQNVFHLLSGTVEGQCMGGCKKMLSVDDKDHSFCNKCWDSIFPPKKTPKKVTFKDDDADCLVKPPCETKIFDLREPASKVSQQME